MPCYLSRFELLKSAFILSYTEPFIVKREEAGFPGPLDDFGMTWRISHSWLRFESTLLYQSRMVLRTVFRYVSLSYSVN